MLISKFILILPNISQSKGNQTMKSGQLIEYNKRNIFLQNSLFFKKAIYEVKASFLQLSFKILSTPSTLHRIRECTLSM